MSVPETSSPFRGIFSKIICLIYCLCKYLEKLEFSKSNDDRKYHSLSPNASFNPQTIQQEFAKMQPSIEEETDDEVFLREIDGDRAR